MTRFFAAAFCLSLAFSTLEGNAGLPRMDVRVRLKRQLIQLEVSGIGLRVGRPNPFLDVALDSEVHHAKIRRTKGGTWLLRFDGARTWQRLPGDRLTIRGQVLRLGQTPAPSVLEVIPRTGQDFDVVATLDLETYLSGVLPAEMPASWPLEALKAQAVAARSFVIRKAHENRDKYFDVDPTVTDQVYRFFSEIHEHPEWVEKINRALNETRGEVLLDHRQKVLKAFYSADCGCQSEDPKFVWGKSESFESVKDPTCGNRPPTLWKFSLERSDVRQKLIAALNLPADTNLRTLQVGARTPSGRVNEVIASLDVQGKIQNLELKAQEFRRIFGFDRIQSTDFTLMWLAEELQVSGKGSGHGVGLCQRGAKTLAEEGMSYRDILKLYYPKAKLLSPKRT